MNINYMNIHCKMFKYLNKYVYVYNILLIVVIIFSTIQLNTAEKKKIIMIAPSFVKTKQSTL